MADFEARRRAPSRRRVRGLPRRARKPARRDPSTPLNAIANRFERRRAGPVLQ